MGSVTAMRHQDSATLPEAIGSYLASIRHPESQRTADQYAATLRRFRAHFATAATVADIPAPAVTEWFGQTWGHRAPATYNRALGVLRSAYGYWTAQGWAPADPTASLRRRRIPADRPRALSRADVDQLLALDDIPLRERVLWRLAYESAARVGELLALDVADLDLPNRRARVTRKGGAVDTVTWQTGTARLLPKMLKGRKSGPLFLTERRARVELAAADLDAATGRARLSYRQAAGRFAEATATMAGGPWTLHQLRHSALTHAAEDGASTSTLLAYSRARLGPVAGPVRAGVGRGPRELAGAAGSGPAPVTAGRMVGGGTPSPPRWHPPGHSRRRSRLPSQGTLRGRPPEPANRCQRLAEAPPASRSGAERTARPGHTGRTARRPGGAPAPRADRRRPLREAAHWWPPAAADAPAGQATGIREWPIRGRRRRAGSQGAHVGTSAPCVLTLACRRQPRPPRRRASKGYRWLSGLHNAGISGAGAMWPSRASPPSGDVPS